MKKLISALLISSAMIQPALAEPQPAWMKGHVVPYVGSFDVFDKDRNVIGGVEFRGKDIGYGFRPSIGAFANEDSDAYMYAGFNLDLFVADRWVVTPGFAVGAYHHGAGKDLGGPLEFRSSIETSYIFDNDYRLGLQLNHLSNAGMYDHNPGQESLIATFHIPTNLF